MNTKITYLYRDAENYKEWNDVVIKGKVSMDSISSFLFEEQFFIPSEVGMPDLQVHEFRTYDHVWHELFEFSLTKEAPTLGINATRLLQLFQKAHESEWNPERVFRRKNLL